MKFSLRNIAFAIIIIICIVSIVLTIYWGIIEPNIDKSPQLDEEMQETLKLEQNFNTIFNNTLDYQGYNVNTTGVTKYDNNKELIYTIVDRVQVVEDNGNYELNLKIPRVNIANNSSVQAFNQSISDIFVTKANEIITGKPKDHTIYTIEYMGYINTNILSLVIKSTLKEGNNAQRVIIDTYNYNLSTNEEISLEQILEIKGLEKEKVESRILNKVSETKKEAETLKELGYHIYERDINNSIYKIENTDNYILGKDGKLYILYPYGNANMTDELDVIVF